MEEGHRKGAGYSWELTLAWDCDGLISEKKI